MAAAVETLQIFREIEALVSDRLQVVSYKWLSRNFSVPSNYAKRLLKDFVDKHGNELKVVYTLSGWLKNSPETYCIKLASGMNLAEVKQEFKDNCSIQVYSVQACIPKDLALLWNAEFVQAEELFSQPSTTENCLRDNRFCGVSNSYVKRTIDPKSAGAVSKLKIDTGISVRPKIMPQSSGKNEMQSSSIGVSCGKNDGNAPVANNQTTKPQVVKDSVTHTDKGKGKNEAPSGAGGSLASLWGRASGKSKSLSPAIDTTSDVPNVPITAEAQISAREAADAVSSDDDDNLNYKREPNNASSSRKRRVIIDFSDEDEEDGNVVRLASPEPPNVQHGPDTSHDAKKAMEKEIPSSEKPKEEKMGLNQDNSEEKISGLSKGELRNGKKNDITGISLQKKAQSCTPKGNDDGDSKVSDKTINGNTSPKRRKVLKTRIDERGREVTEVVWEGEATDSKAEKNTTKSDTGNRPPVVNKAQPAGRIAPTNSANKAGNKKPTKGGAKDAKQGNILSFFKKV